MSRAYIFENISETALAILIKKFVRDIHTYISRSKVSFFYQKHFARTWRPGSEITVDFLWIYCEPKSLKYGRYTDIGVATNHSEVGYGILWATVTEIRGSIGPVGLSMSWFTVKFPYLL